MVTAGCPLSHRNRKWFLTASPGIEPICSIVKPCWLPGSAHVFVTGREVAASSHDLLPGLCRDLETVPDGRRFARWRFGSSKARLRHHEGERSAENCEHVTYLLQRRSR